MSFFTRLLTAEVRQTATSVRQHFTTKDQPTRQWPLNLGLGKTVEIDMPPALVLVTDKLKAKRPQGDLTVIGLSDYDVSGLTYHRAYLKDERDEIFTLQLELVKGSRDAIQEAILYSVWTEVAPATSEEWGGWLQEGGLIGSRWFAAADATDDERYLRQIAGRDYHEPLQTREFIDRFLGFEDNDLLHESEVVTLKLMPYTRQVLSGVTPVTEYCLVQCVETDAEASIVILAGVPVELSRIRVL